MYLPLDRTSFDLNLNSTDLEIDAFQNHQYIPIVAFNTLQFFGNYGVGSVPNMMMCEVFAAKSKAFATGIVATILYLSMFLASKSFYILETLMTLPGLGIFYGGIGLIGYACRNKFRFFSHNNCGKFVFPWFRFVGMYLTLPETEGRTLDEVESYFADRKRKFHDIQIPRKGQTTATTTTTTNC